VERLTLVAPFFLQARPARLARWAPAARLYLRRVSSEALSVRLTGTAAHAAALQSSAADLRRGSVAATAARYLADTADPRWRDGLRAGLRRYPGPVHVIVGSEDPLATEGRALLDALPQVTVTVIDGAGHHPQLTHREGVARAIAGT
jgi:pimeloyl-ACP methyl ester carboxylesterase